MNRALLLLIAVCCLLGAAGWVAWEPFANSSQEGVANFAKALDWFRGMEAGGGLVWWSPNFQGGTSLAPFWGTFLSGLWLWSCVQWLGVVEGIKFAMLACIPVAGATAFLLIRRLSGIESMALWGGLFYAASSSIWVRMMGVEHVVVVMGMALLPLACWAVVRIVQRPSVLSALACAVSCSLVALAYSKTAVLAAPLLAGLVLWGFWKHCGVAAWLQPRVGGTLIGSSFLLAALPNLPAARESGFAALFEFGPMAGWREAFASKSAVQFFDRLGVISGDFRGDFAASTAAGGYYMGLVPLLVLAVVLILRERVQASEGGEHGFSVLRLTLGLGFFAFWLSHGPFSVFSGTLRALEASGVAADFMPAVLWVLLAVQGWVIWVLFPGRMPLRWAAAVMVLAVYFLVPGFSWVSWLPIYSEIRAPFDFYQVAGVVWVCAAAGVAAVLVWRLVTGRAARVLLVIAAAVILAWDFSGNLHWAEERALARGVRPAFEETADFLRNADGVGAIYAISGRYFYLLLPQMTGRPLVNEAFQNYLQQRNLAGLAALAAGSPPDFGEFLRVSGVRYIFVDRNDPDKPVEMVENFKGRYERVFQNAEFEIYEVPGCLAPAFLARDAVLLASEELMDIGISFEVAGRDLAAIGPVLPGRSAGAIGEGTLKLDEDFGAQKGEAFRPLPADAVRFVGPGAIDVDLPGGGGWVIVPQAWHPDWTASSGGDPRIVYTAFGAFLALENDGPGTVSLRFSPPWWYAGALGLSGLGWLACLGLLAACALPNVRSALDQTNEPAPLAVERPPILKPVAIIPTYNEAASIRTVLEGVLAADPALSVLVVDDGSPDGTPGHVREHAAFGSRIFLVERAGKLGLGSAYRDGFQWAREKGHDACIEIDADMSHNPADIPRLLDGLAAGNDAAIGSRYLNGLRVVNWPEHRLLVSAFGTQFVRFFTGLPLTDATSGFKALRLTALSALDWSQIRAEGYGFQVELHHALWRAGARITEVPITFTERAEGTTKMTAGIAWEAMRRVLDLTFRRNPSPDGASS